MTRARTAIGLVTALVAGALAGTWYQPADTADAAVGEYRWMSVPAAALQPDDQVIDALNDGYQASVSGGGSMVAPVVFPHSSVKVRRVYVFYKDDGVGDQMMFSFRRVNLSDGTFDDMDSVWTTGASADARRETLRPKGKIGLGQAAYLYVYWDSVADLEDVVVYGVRVEYAPIG